MICTRLASLCLHKNDSSFDVYIAEGGQCTPAAFRNLQLMNEVIKIAIAEAHYICRGCNNIVFARILTENK